LLAPGALRARVLKTHFTSLVLMRYTLGFYEREIVEANHSITPGGARYFGVLLPKATVEHIVPAKISRGDSDAQPDEAGSVVLRR
jgi:hypothetical protein